MLSVGAAITDFSIFTAHASADGGNEFSNTLRRQTEILHLITIPELYKLRKAPQTPSLQDFPI